MASSFLRPSNFKRPAFDSPAMRDGARDTMCVLCKINPTQCCAHLPTKQIGFMGGVAGKVPDWLIADLCQECHLKMDGVEWRNDIEIRMKAHCLTIQRRFDQGILVVIDPVRGTAEDHYWPTWEFQQ